MGLKCISVHFHFVHNWQRGNFQSQGIFLLTQEKNPLNVLIVTHHLLEKITLYGIFKVTMKWSKFKLWKTNVFLFFLNDTAIVVFVLQMILEYLYLLQYVPIKLGPQEYSCPLCPKISTRKDHMQNHIAAHTGEKPYKCSYCEKMFTRRDHCMRHMRRQHEMK